MVDFSKKLVQKNIAKTTDPVKLYDSLDRASDKGPLRPAQEAILRLWNESRRQERDVIIKLHTGQGKTLIGLLMLQSLLNENGGPVVYLCPNNYLIKQTCLQAKQFGVPYCIATPDLPHEFTDGKAILITSVQKLFNGLSRFGMGLKSLPITSILMDDCHACIDSIREAFNIELSREDTPYHAIVELFSESLQEQGIGTFAEIKKGDYGSFLQVPYWSWIQRQDEVVKILAGSSNIKALKYVWPIMRDRLSHCQCLISGQKIEIVPYLPPLELFGSYWNAQHRLFMSATVTDDSFLVKGLHLVAESITNPLIFDKEKWSGEKMVLIPSLLDGSLDRKSIIAEFAPTKPNRAYGVLALTPSFKYAEGWSSTGAVAANKENIESEIDRLKSGQGDQTLVAASRYDGIDLPDDACRILVLDSLPRAQSLLDRHMEHCRAGSTLIAIRAARMIEQGLGRSVRGEKDYSVIIVTGPELVKALRSKHFRNHLSEQTKMQIELGLSIAEMGRDDIEKGQPPIEVFKNLIDQCLKRNPDWKSFYIEKMDGLSSSLKEGTALALFQSELKAEQQFQRGEIDGAVDTLQDLIDTHVQESSDRGWYLQEMARYRQGSQESESNRLQLAAHKQNGFLLKPRVEIQVTRLGVNQKRVTGVIEWLKRFEGQEDLMLAVEDIVSRLSFGVEADQFEAAIDDLGTALGFATERPDKKWKAGPDNLWCLRDGEYLLVECKNQVKLERDVIYKDESGQMNNACAWFNQNYPGTKVSRVIIIPTNKCGDGAGFVEEVHVMKKIDLKKLTKNFKTFISEFRSVDPLSITEQKVQDLFESHSLSIESIQTGYARAIDPA